MANVIHKFRLAPIGVRITIKMQSGAFVTRIGMQDNVPHAWVMIDDEKPADVPNHFMVIGTGRKVPDGYWPVQGATFFDGPYVWHGLHKVGGDA